MPIPKYHKLMAPMLRELQDDRMRSLGDLERVFARQFGVTEEELAECYEGKKIRIFYDRIGWARTYLKKAGLIETPQAKHVKITQNGKNILPSMPQDIDSKFLMQFEGFQEFKNKKKSDDAKDGSDCTPTDGLEHNFEEMNEALKSDILAKLNEAHPKFLEQVGVEVVQKLGYGVHGETTPYSGDGGIDGVVYTDALGFNKVLIQTKRYGSTVPIAAVREFAGVLTGHEPNKGIFITTSNFTKETRDFINSSNASMMLIDGDKLAEYMIEYQVGSKRKDTYYVNEIDEDYFAEMPSA